MNNLLSQTELAEIAEKMDGDHYVTQLLGHIRALESMPAGVLLSIIESARVRHDDDDEPYVEFFFQPGVTLAQWLPDGIRPMKAVYWTAILSTSEGGLCIMPNATLIPYLEGFLPDMAFDSATAAIAAARIAAQLPPLDVQGPAQPETVNSELLSVCERALELLNPDSMSQHRLIYDMQTAIANAKANAKAGKRPWFRCEDCLPPCDKEGYSIFVEVSNGSMSLSEDRYDYEFKEWHNYKQQPVRWRHLPPTEQGGV